MVSPPLILLLDASSRTSSLSYPTATSVLLLSRSLSRCSTLYRCPSPSLLPSLSRFSLYFTLRGRLSLFTTPRFEPWHRLQTLDSIRNIPSIRSPLKYQCLHGYQQRTGDSVLIRRESTVNGDAHRRVCIADRRATATAVQPFNPGEFLIQTAQESVNKELILRVL